jgi:hypothetical protein
MTIAELIAELQTFQADLEVRLHHEAWGLRPVDAVRRVAMRINPSGAWVEVVEGRFEAARDSDTQVVLIEHK